MPFLCCCAVCGDLWVVDPSPVPDPEPIEIGHQVGRCRQRTERPLVGEDAPLHDSRAGRVVASIEHPDNRRFTTAMSRSFVAALPDEAADHYWVLAKLFDANPQE